MAREIAYHPNVVGEGFERLAFETAEQALPAILELSQVMVFKDATIVFEQVLPAVPDKLHQAASRLIPDSEVVFRGTLKG